MSTPKVLIIGCGVAGPVVALFLQRKGYSPVVLERSKSLGYEGSALSLAPNGYFSTNSFILFSSLRSLSLKVLSVLGLTTQGWKDAAQVYAKSRDLTYDGTLLTESTTPSTLVQKYGQPMIGMLRSVLNCSLKNALSSAGIPLISEFKVSQIVEGIDQVTVMAEDGRKEEGSFVIGCDGLSSVVRASIMKSRGLPFEPVNFTGIEQVCLSPSALENIEHLTVHSTAQRHLANSTSNVRSS
jgi:2-polyprenyl-6-methoxyphenol hydroxylase-like FAD-dependent oxidoreductase